ncbi:hypothetical protein O9992_28720 [Vibrio lentus]|nr:hypothetical protein [Vibrio lentus]
MWEKSASGTLVPMFVKVNRVASDNEKDEFDMVLTLSDLSNVKEMEDSNTWLIDALTGLANEAQL